MANKSEQVYEQKRLYAQLIGCEDCFEDLSLDLKEYDDSIAEIEGMIAYYVSIGNMQEVASWRRMLQQTKVEKRHAKKMIENTKRMEYAFT